MILTDYLDGQMNSKEKESLEEHLAGCPGCLEFARVARRSVFEPFFNIEKPGPSELVWSKIKESILAQEKPKRNILMDFGQRLFFPKPVLALVTVMIFILAIGIFNQFRINQQSNPNEQEEYLSQLADLSADLSVNDEQGFGTLVERYFL